MNIYEQKSKTKFWLAMFAALIVVASLWYTSILSGRIADNENKQVQIWAQAVEERAILVERTRQLYEQLAEEERKRVKLWAEATQQMLSSPGVDVDPLTFRIFTSISGLPRLRVNERNEIMDAIDLEEGMEFTRGTLFTDALRKSFTSYEPIRMETAGVVQLLYYRDSRLFTEIKDEIQRVINSFISEVLVNAASVPVIYADSLGQVIDYGNLSDEWIADSAALQARMATMQAQNEPIRVQVGEGQINYIYYEDSELLTQIQYYPYVQLAVIALFLLIAYYAFSNARKAEQNQVWVGMSKETAHQLGTPISSLSGWVEYLKEQDLNPDMLQELEKDVSRLELIADRFSKIGSAPTLTPTPISEALQPAVHYLKTRASSQVTIRLDIADEATVQLNAPLFDWVIENLVKNALDAIEGSGNITIEVHKISNSLAIDVTDTGKGIPKSRFKQVFQPGYSTKKRGWGLGLTLTKRIVENYHKGKIFVKSSTVGKGTTFRILLPL